MEGSTVSATGRLIACVIAAAAAGLPAHASGQSLAEVAKREAQRRAAAGAAAPARVYTNSDLTPDFTKPPAPPDAPKPAAPSTEAKPAENTPLQAETAVDHRQTPTEETEPTPRDMKGEEYWRTRAAQMRTRLSAQQGRVNALAARMMALASAQSPAEQQEREVTGNALESARADLSSLEAEWAKFEAQAQAQDIPAAWIR
jgi:hypothetical protein